MNTTKYPEAPSNLEIRYQPTQRSATNPASRLAVTALSKPTKIERSQLMSWRQEHATRRSFPCRSWFSSELRNPDRNFSVQRRVAACAAARLEEPVSSHPAPLVLGHLERADCERGAESPLSLTMPSPQTGAAPRDGPATSISPEILERVRKLTAQLLADENGPALLGAILEGVRLRHGALLRYDSELQSLALVAHEGLAPQAVEALKLVRRG